MLQACTQDEAISKSLSKERICAVIVTYHPDADFPQRTARIAGQVGGLVIVDNHSNSRAVTMLRETCSQLNAHLILNDDNLGIATGLNLGVRWAKEQGYSWALTLDQDTGPAEFMVETLLGVYEALNENEKDRIAIIGSGYLDASSQRCSFLQVHVPNGQPWVETKTVITSGSLVSIAAFETIGRFRDEFFIDFVDIDYCLRASSKGYRVLLACKPLMQHSIGAMTVHRLPWKQTGTSNHSELRLYYMARNLTVLIQEYLFREPALILHLLFSRLKSTILMCLFEERKLAKLIFTAEGIFDGLTRNFKRK
jgi:rhamnosyltransferase